MSFFLYYKEDNMKCLLVVQLFKNDYFCKIYLVQVKMIVEENFSNGWYKEKVVEICDMISEEVIKDLNCLYFLE